MRHERDAVTGEVTIEGYTMFWNAANDPAMQLTWIGTPIRVNPAGCSLIPPATECCKLLQNSCLCCRSPCRGCSTTGRSPGCGWTSAGARLWEGKGGLPVTGGADKCLRGMLFPTGAGVERRGAVRRTCRPPGDARGRVFIGGRLWVVCHCQV